MKGIYQQMMEKPKIVESEPFTLESFKKIMEDLFHRRHKKREYSMPVGVLTAISLYLPSYIPSNMKVWPYVPKNRVKGEEQYIYLSLWEKHGLWKAKAYLRGNGLWFRIYYGTKLLYYTDSLTSIQNQAQLEKKED